MPWHSTAVAASHQHYSTQLDEIVEIQWIRNLRQVYENGIFPWETSGLEPAPIGGYLNAINELTLGFGNETDQTKRLIIGREAAYAPSLGSAEDRIAYAVEGCSLTGLWRDSVGIAEVAAIAQSAAGNPWPDSVPPWHDQPLPFYRDPSTYYRVRGGHTWRKLAMVVAGGSMTRLFSENYVLDISSIPSPRGLARSVSSTRLSFLEQILRNYAAVNGAATVWFHGVGLPSPNATPAIADQVPLRQATHRLLNAFFGETSPLPVVKSFPYKGRKHSFSIYRSSDRRLVFSSHASGSTRVPREYWSTLATYL